MAWFRWKSIPAAIKESQPEVAAAWKLGQKRAKERCHFRHCYVLLSRSVQSKGMAWFLWKSIPAAIKESQPEVAAAWKLGQKRAKERCHFRHCYVLLSRSVQSKGMAWFLWKSIPAAIKESQPEVAAAWKLGQKRAKERCHFRHCYVLLSRSVQSKGMAWFLWKSIPAAIKESQPEVAAAWKLGQKRAKERCHFRHCYVLLSRSVQSKGMAWFLWKSIPAAIKESQPEVAAAWKLGQKRAKERCHFRHCYVLLSRSVQSKGMAWFLWKSIPAAIKESQPEVAAAWKLGQKRAKERCHFRHCYVLLSRSVQSKGMAWFLWKSIPAAIKESQPEVAAAWKLGQKRAKERCHFRHCYVLLSRSVQSKGMAWFLWKSIPAAIKESQPEVAAAWKLGQKRAKERCHFRHCYVLLSRSVQSKGMAWFLWKSIPAAIKESQPEVAAAWKLGQKLWSTRDYAGVHEAVRAFDWSQEARGLVNSFSDVLQQGWLVHPVSRMLTVKKLPVTSEKKLNPDKLQLLTGNNARFLRKSIPAAIKESQPEVTAAWKLAQKLWSTRDYAGVHEAVWAFDWSQEARGLVNSFSEAYTGKIFQLLCYAYSTVSIQDAALFLGMTEDDVTNYVLQQGCLVHPVSRMLTVKKLPVTREKKLNPDKLQLLTGMVYDFKVSDINLPPLRRRSVPYSGRNQEFFLPDDQQIRREQMLMKNHLDGLILYGEEQSELIGKTYAIAKKVFRVAQSDSSEDLGLQLFVYDDRDFVAESYVQGQVLLSTYAIEFLEKVGSSLLIAFTLAHEAGHVLANHIGEALSVDKLLLIRELVRKVKGAEITAQGLEDLYLADLSKRDEFESDGISLMILAAAGFDPRPIPGLLRMLDWHEDPYYYPDSYSSHPSWGQRAEEVEKIMEQAVEIFTRSA